MNTLSKYVLLLLVSVLAACGSDDDAAATFTTGTPQPGDALAVTITASDFVTDGDPDTRATDKGPVTTFEDGDRVGIIILDRAKKPLYNNIPYKYVSSSQTWEFDSNNGEGKEICYYDSKARTYIVYYPYSAKADDCKSESDLKAIFKPQTDQSRKEDYRASDLMVNTTTSVAPLKSLTASLTHAYASVSLSPITQYILDDGAEPKNTCTSPSLKISDINFTIGDAFYVPYQATDGSLRCILPAEFTTGNIRCFYTVGSKTYGNEINITTVEANKRYTSAPEITYSLDDAKVGDFYCKNSKNEGYLIPGDATLTNNQQTACIGIVYCIDTERIGEAAKSALTGKGVTPHGLVMALTDASEQCRWGEDGKDENSSGVVGTPFQDNTTTLQKQYNNVDGYGETHWILEAYRDNGTTLQDKYTAFYHASRYGTVDSGTSQYAAPANTTGWFIPSMGQWWDILSYLGGIDLKDYRADQEEDISISGAALTAVDNMNKYLEKISDATMFSTGTYFRSSSEFDSDFACGVYFYGTDSSLDLLLDRGTKNDSDYKVRCVFAF